MPTASATRSKANSSATALATAARRGDERSILKVMPGQPDIRAATQMWAVATSPPAAGRAAQCAGTAEIRRPGGDVRRLLTEVDSRQPRSAAIPGRAEIGSRQRRNYAPSARRQGAMRPEIIPVSASSGMVVADYVSSSDRVGPSVHRIGFTPPADRLLFRGTVCSARIIHREGNSANALHADVGSRCDLDFDQFRRTPTYPWFVAAVLRIL